jgi:hypothetical protein
MTLPNWLIALALVCIPTVAHGEIELPTISPSTPNVRDSIVLLVRATGGCDGFTDLANEAELSRQGPGQLRLVVDGVATLSGDGLCIFPDFTYRFELGARAPGSYSLQLLVRDPYVRDGTLVPAGTVEFEVKAAFVIPANSIWALAGLILTIASCVAAREQSRKRYSR